MYLFVVYFSFAPVISANMHPNVNLFDIQVLMMVTETFTSTSDHKKFTEMDYVFMLPSYCRILIHIYFHTVLSKKNKYQIQSHTTFNMDDSKTIYYTYENLLVVAYFSINGRFCLVSLGNPTFSNIFSTCRTYSFDFWIMKAICTFMYLFVV